eukprot:gene11045-14830_t
MGSRRKLSDLKQKSIWEEPLIEPLIPNEKQRSKLWNYLISRQQCEIQDIPFRQWNISSGSTRVIYSDFVKFTTTVVGRFESSKGDSIKLLVELQDGHQVETVIMKHRGHATVCVSSQIGCQMGCKFCATGTMGIIGDLLSSEIIEQIVHANTITKIRNVVFMGMGEPLNNYDNVKRAVEFLINDKRFALSPRHVTVSTVGVIKNMYRLSKDLPQVSLAVSLHAPNQEVRLQIVPAASSHKLEKLLDAIDNHILCSFKFWNKSNGSVILNSWSNLSDITNSVRKKSPKGPGENTQIMIEYILIRDINDKECHAHELGELLKSRRDFVLLNLIPYNPTEVAEAFLPPTEESINRFFNICSENPYKIHTRVRLEKGQDIAGACGQLALVKTSSNQEIKEIEDIGSSSQNNSALLKPSDRQGNATTSYSILTSLYSTKWKNNNIASIYCMLNIAIPIMINLWSMRK